ncbi:MAG: holo-ACP synthase [Syntrophomonadaceae bacterium]|nr:holo-ACP synthase [Syntrophomonadaceae bacterium]
MIGIDLIEIERLKAAMLRTGRFKTRVFTPDEISYCESKANPYQSFAARFAAREAFRKLHPSFTAGIQYHEVEVAVGPEGRPFFKLHGEALVRVEKLNIGHIDLSLSHAGDYAMAAAVAVVEYKGG